MLVFGERRKPEYPEKNLSEQSREPTNSTHLWRRVRDSNPGYIGGRQALSPLLDPCSGTIGLIVAPWKFDVLKTSIFALRTTNFRLSADSSSTKTRHCLNRNFEVGCFFLQKYISVTTLVLTFFNIFSRLLINCPLDEFLVPTIYRVGNYVFFVTDCNLAKFVKFVLFFEIVKLS